MIYLVSNWDVLLHKYFFFLFILWTSVSVIKYYVTSITTTSRVRRSHTLPLQFDNRFNCIKIKTDWLNKRTWPRLTNANIFTFCKRLAESFTNDVRHRKKSLFIFIRIVLPILIGNKWYNRANDITSAIWLIKKYRILMWVMKIALR